MPNAIILTKLTAHGRKISTVTKVADFYSIRSLAKLHFVGVRDLEKFSAIFTTYGGLRKIYYISVSADVSGQEGT